MPPAKGASPALSRAKNELTKYRSKLSQVRRDARQSELPNALMGAGAVLLGAAGCGVGRGFVGDELMGVPTDVGLGLLVGGISIGVGSPFGVMLAAGCLAPYVGDAAKDAVETMGMGGMGQNLLPEGFVTEETVNVNEYAQPNPFTADFG